MSSVDGPATQVGAEVVSAYQARVDSLEAGHAKMISVRARSAAELLVTARRL